MTADLNRRVAIEVMEWEWKKPWGTDKFSWFDGRMFHHDFWPETKPAMCDLAIRKMQSDGWEYRRTDVHQFTKEHNWKPEMLVGSVPVGDDNGFNCPEVCEAMLKAKKVEYERSVLRGLADDDNTQYITTENTRALEDTIQRTKDIWGLESD